MIEAFFKEAIDFLKNKTCYCENCKNKLYSVSKMNLGHILPKSIFKSVATNKDNLMLLCWICHSNYDSSWKKAITMPCFKIAKERYNKFKPYIEEHRPYLKHFEDE